MARRKGLGGTRGSAQLRARGERWPTRKGLGGGSRFPIIRIGVNVVPHIMECGHCGFCAETAENVRDCVSVSYTHLTLPTNREV